MHDFTLIDSATQTCAERKDIFQLATVCDTLMQGHGAGTGATLSLAIQDRFLLAQWLLAGLLCGYTVNPLNPDLSPQEIANVMKMADTVLLITDQDKTGADIPCAHVVQRGTCVNEMPEQPRVPVTALSGNLLIFTSGTTGDPKGVFLNAQQLMHNAQTAVDRFGFDGNWVTGSVLPLFHTFTLVSDLLTMWITGGTCVVCAGFSAATINAIGIAFATFGVNSYSGVPIIFKMLGRFGDPAHYRHVRFAIAGAAPLYEDTRLAYPRLGHEILPCYGLSEACCFVTISSPGAIVARAVGTPADLDMLILAENSEGIEASATAGERGEICIRGKSVITHGYWKRPDTARDAYTNGYFRTGDIGFLDAAGFLHITGRRKNMLIKGGEKFYLEDFDRALSRVEGIRDTACIVTHCDENDDEYTCCVVADSDVDEPLKAYIRQHLVSLFGARAAPAKILEIDEIPRTPTGKTRIDRLRKLVGELA